MVFMSFPVFAILVVFCISLVTSDVEHIFICFLNIEYLLLKSFAHFSLGCSLLLICKSSSCI